MATDIDSSGGERASQRAFARRVNHTLRGDIQSLRAALDAARSQAGGVGAFDALSEEFAGVERALDHLQRRTLDIALLTMAESDALDAHLQLRPLRWVAEAAARAARSRAARLKLTLRCETSASGDARARIDRELMLRALGALLENAMRFSPRRGVITVTAERDAEVGRFIVRDQGIGFPPGDLDRFFAPYEAGANEETSRDDGLGLGLAVARAVAWAHSGRAYVIKECAPGAAVAIELLLA